MRSKFNSTLTSYFFTEKSSPGLKPGTVSWGCGLHFYNVLFEINNFGLGATFPLCLVSELQELPSWGFELRTFFLSFDFCKLFFSGVKE